MERLNSLWGVMAILLWVSIISVQSHANPQAPFSVSPDGGGNNVPLNAAQQQYRQQEQKQQDKIRQQLSQQQQHNRQQQLNQQQQETLNQQQPTLNQQQPTLNQQQQRNHQQQRPNIPVPGSIPRPSQQSVNGVPNVVPIRRPNQRPIPGPLAINTRRRVEDTQVQCLKTHMMVTFRFSEPFNGFIYPHKQFAKCLLFRGQNSLEASMQLKHGTCGDQENKIVFRGKSFLDPVIEHRLMVQWERDIVSEDDSTVIVRCDRPDDFNKTIEWKFGTRELSATLERSQHPGPKMWMEIQRGEGPTAPPLGTDPIYIGDVMTLVFTLSDNVYWFDSNIFTCHALDGGQERQQIEWDTTDTAASSQSRDFSGQSTVIENGCSVKPKLFSHFFKERNTMPNGDLVTLHYGHFKAFRFPSSMRVVLQCDVQVCYKECPSPDPCSEAFHPRLAEEQTTRRRREAESTDDEAHEIDRVEMFRTLEILLAEEGGEQRIPVNSQILQGALEEYCYSPTVYYTTVIALVCIIVFLIILVAVIFLRGKMHSVSFFSPTKNVK